MVEGRFRVAICYSALIDDMWKVSSSNYFEVIGGAIALILE